MLEARADAGFVERGDDDLFLDRGHHLAALDAVIFDDAPIELLRALAGELARDGVEGFLIDDVAGGRERQREGERSDPDEVFHHGARA